MIPKIPGYYPPESGFTPFEPIKVRILKSFQISSKLIGVIKFKKGNEDWLTQTPAHEWVWQAGGLIVGLGPKHQLGVYFEKIGV